ncbi:MAG: hypothetical protein V7740_10565 [Pseudomonas marincola]
MKFLMFNLVVGAALIFLFTSDKTEYQAAANDAHETVQALKGGAQNVVAQIQPTAKPQVLPSQHAVSTSSGDEISVAYAPADEAPDDLTRLADVLEDVTPSRTENVANLDRAEFTPDVAKRREQILAPDNSENATPKFTIETRKNRQEELQSLSEEMELFSVEVSVQ